MFYTCKTASTEMRSSFYIRLRLPYSHVGDVHVSSDRRSSAYLAGAGPSSDQMLISECAGIVALKCFIVNALV